MSLQPGIAPRRLLQTHGAFINTTLANRLRLRRRFSEGEPVKPYTPAGIADDSVEGRRTAQAYEVTSNDEVFDAREGEIMVSSTDLTGFPNSRRAAVFSSLNGWKAPYPDARDALHASDFNFVGLCQNGFVSSNTALQSQGMTCQASGIKTVVNNSNETIDIGDRLYVDTMDRIPERKGIPHEKMTLVLRKVKKHYMANYVAGRVFEEFQGKKLLTEETPADVRRLVGLTIAATVKHMRKAGKWVVGTAMSAARKGEQMDVLLTKPSFL